MKEKYQVIKLGLTLLVGISSFSIKAQDTYQRNPAVDIQHYTFNLTLNDENNLIKGTAFVIVKFKGEPNNFQLDLVEKKGKYGMQLLDVLENESPAIYEFKNNKITIIPKSKNITSTYTLIYEGMPQKGLVIDQTKYGQRSFFGDNWPNLARHWLPCIDHPYDKASVEFQIIAPDYYQVVATGKKIEESSIGNGQKLTRYFEPAPVAMKVVTIGVTKFATVNYEEIDGIEVSAWVYPENREAGFYDYQLAVDVLKYFKEKIGVYSYAKLANMQAKTQWGGLENAGTIAYAENSVSGKRNSEGLIAHEIAHQWFGNSVTENDWNHVWLSEGFATYFAILYQENKYGDEKRKSELELDRRQIINYNRKKSHPIVDSTIRNPFRVLNTNTYQKASWVLNMLRKKIGDEKFWDGIQKYYQTYKDQNTLTKDFVQVMKEASNIELSDFFDQWIFESGHPILQWDWNYKEGKIYLDIRQIQKKPVLQFPLEIGIKTKNDQKLETLRIDKKENSFEIEIGALPIEIIIDPNSWTLFELAE